VHRNLGPGLLESVYRECLCGELLHAGLKVEQEKFLPLIYKGTRLRQAYRVDLVVEELVVVEIKAVMKIESVHEAQLLTYLKLTGLKLGLILNFYVAVMKSGIKRMVL
jgi:GxxExxY protein